MMPKLDGISLSLNSELDLGISIRVLHETESQRMVNKTANKMDSLFFRLASHPVVLILVRIVEFRVVFGC